MNNGRIELKDQNYTKSSLFTNDELLNSKEDIPVNSIYEENPVQIKFLRRDIARLKTAIVNRDMKINFKDNEPEQ